MSLFVVGLAVEGLVETVPAGAASNAKLSGSYSYIATDVCQDPVHIDGQYDETVHTYFDQQGNAIRLAFTGKVTVRYTDLVSGATYRPNSSGPATVDLATGQTVIRGGNGTLFDANGVLVATDGRIVLDALGFPISVIHHSTDVCSQLGTIATPI